MSAVSFVTLLAVVVSIPGTALAAVLESASIAMRARSRSTGRALLVLDVIAVALVVLNVWAIRSWMSFEDAFDFADPR